MLENKKFYAPDAGEVGYGYASDEVRTNPFTFGLNAGNCFLTKFEWIPNGGKEGAEQEALDIIFTINGTEKSYRQFPVSKAFGENNEEITDPKHVKFKEARTDFNAKITHILHCFQNIDTIKAAFSRPIADFKQFCQIAQSILPANYRNMPLDIFLQYGWNLREGQKKTYLEVPNKMKYGKWLCPAMPGTWETIRVENPTETTREALKYGKKETATEVDGVITYHDFHPFVKNGWFMLSNFANQQKAEGVEEEAITETTTEVGEVNEEETKGTASTAAAW